MGNHLCDHRIIIRTHFGATLNPSVHSHISGKLHLREQSAAGLKIPAGVFRIHAGFNGMPIRNMTKLGKRNLITGCEPHHPLDEIDSRDFLCYAMLDLKPGVDLEKIELFGFRVVHELAGARGTISSRLTQPARCLVKSLTDGVCEAGSGRFFQNLLISALG